MTSSRTNDTTSSGIRVSLSPAPKEEKQEPPTSLDLISEAAVSLGKFELPKCQIPPKKELEPVEVFLANAVNGTNYKALIDAFRVKKNLDILYKIIIALRTSGVLNTITSDPTKHAHLMHHIIRLDPFIEDDYKFADAQFHLITALVSANTVFCVPVLTALWKLVVFGKTDVPQPRLLRIHACIATLLRLIPKARSEVFPIVSSHVPYRMRPEPELSWYFRQCLKLVEYSPSIQPQVLELVIHTCLELDVEIKITDVGDAVIDDEKDEDPKTSQESEDVPVCTDENQENEKDTNQMDVDGMADRLDSLMVILFEHIRNSNHLVIFEHLSAYFESSILITHKSKFVQYLILYVCGLDAEESDQPLYREFASKLIEVILDPYRAEIIRQSGSCYLASFVSRASYTCPETCCESIDVLLRWAEAYIESLGEYSALAADGRKQCSSHSLFYTVCQSAFYIMCFRGSDVMKHHKSSDLGIDMGTARWTRVCSHSLNPLKYCLESVRVEFLRISRLFDLIEERTLVKLEKEASASNVKPRRKRVSLISTAATLEKERISGGVGGLGRGTNPLDSFFPFDPYLLMRSHESIEPFYKHWDGGANIEDFEDVTAPALEDVPLDHDPTDFQDPETTEHNKRQHLDDEASESDQVELGRKRLKSATSNVASVDDEASEADEVKAGRKRLMSVASNATSVGSQVEVRVEWETEFKRARTLSIENGSW